MARSVYQVGTRVVTPEATYDFDQPADASRFQEVFRDVFAEEDRAVRSLRVYNAHLEALLGGANYESRGPVAAIDPAVDEIPKKTVAATR